MFILNLYFTFVSDNNEYMTDNAKLIELMEALKVKHGAKKVAEVLQGRPMEYPNHLLSRLRNGQEFTLTQANNLLKFKENDRD